MTEKVYSVLLDPRWKWGKLSIDGKEHIFISLQHPEHMGITCLVPRDVARQMGEALLKLSNT